MSEEHKRRVHYAGKYPRRFEEKYKELNPEQYAEMAEHVKQKGNTPAGTHISIMVKEILEQLRIQPGERGLDCTLGYGGHSRHMLEQLQGQGHLTALDIDPIESAKTRERMRELGYAPGFFDIELLNFADLDKAAEKYGKFDFLLADLGVSSMQIDNPERGFTFKADGPLDLRMDPSHGIPASERLKEMEEDEIAGMLVENADEPYAEEIAHQICALRKKWKPVETTMQLRDVVVTAVQGVIDAAAKSGNTMKTEEAKQLIRKSCTRTFQALRIEINHEYESLYALMEKLPDVMAPGGRVAILTFHSGEDRIVKKALKQGLRDGLYMETARDVIRPSAAECAANPRATSTKLRWAIRADF